MFNLSPLVVCVLLVGICMGMLFKYMYDRSMPSVNLTMLQKIAHDMKACYATFALALDGLNESILKTSPSVKKDSDFSTYVGLLNDVRDELMAVNVKLGDLSGGKLEKRSTP